MKFNNEKMALIEDFIDISDSLTGVKRSFSGSDFNGREKRIASENPNSEVVFRILCPSAKIGSVIGKGGSIIKNIREETGARVKIGEPVIGVDERVIYISGIDDTEKNVSPAQEGFLRVYSRIVDAGEDAGPSDGQLRIRMLVSTVQIGCILGKGGSVISKMREESGSQIRVLPKDQLPGCALHTDEIVQVIGEDASVRKALELIASQLRSNPPKERINVFQSRNVISNSLIISTPQFGNQVTAKPASFPSFPSIPPHKSYPMSEPYPANLAFNSSDFSKPTAGKLIEVNFRIICNGAKIGGIIGKGGSIIKLIREETGARIKISDEVNGSPDRVVIVSGNEDINSQFSPAQEALFRVQERILEREKGENPDTLFTRILIPNSQIGCIMGKGGSIITEMRRISRASIRLMPKEQIPLCAQEGDEFIQIVGEANANRIALQHVSSRLRFYMLKEPEMNPSLSSISSLSSLPPPLSSIKIEKMNPYPSMALSENPLMVPNLDNDLNQNFITVFVSVPLPAIGSIIGRGGSHISQIRTISGSKVRLLEVQEGQTDRVVEVFGTPSQVKTAQDLINAFILNSAATANEHPPLPY